MKIPPDANVLPEDPVKKIRWFWPCVAIKKFAPTRCAMILQSSLVEHSTYIVKRYTIRSDMIDRTDRHDTTRQL